MDKAEFVKRVGEGRVLFVSSSECKLIPRPAWLGKVKGLTDEIFLVPLSLFHLMRDKMTPLTRYGIPPVQSPNERKNGYKSGYIEMGLPEPGEDAEYFLFTQ